MQKPTLVSVVSDTLPSLMRAKMVTIEQTGRQHSPCLFYFARLMRKFFVVVEPELEKKKDRIVKKNWGGRRREGREGRKGGEEFETPSPLIRHL